MKKKILSFLLCLCMVAVLLPTTALADETPESYGYAYDVQRTPFALEGQPGNNIELWGLAAPRNSKGSDDGMQSNGSWTLTKVGTYSYMKINRKNTNNLNDIVDYVAGAYVISDKKDTIVIHELKLNESGTDTHIAYGVIIANDQTNGNVLFIGDSLSGSGAGYLLSTGSRNRSVTVTAGEIATDVVEQIASIALDPAKLTFPAATEGYGEQAPLTVTVNNTGNVDTGLLNITLSGDNADSFTVEETVIGNIGTDSNGAPFQVKPITGLAAGTYTATVTVSGTGTNVDAREIEVSFTVNPASQSTPVVIIVPDDTTNTADPAKNPETGDNSTHLLWAVMASSALCAAALLFSSRRRGEEMQ